MILLGRRLQVMAVAAVLVLVAVGATWYVTQVRGESRTVTCRLLNDPSHLSDLSAGVIDDLRSEKARVKVSDLKTLSEQDARSLASFRSSHSVVWACGYRDDGEVAVISRSKELKNHCLATACGDETRVWVTCYRALDLVTKKTTLHGRCIGFPSNISSS